MPSGDGLILFRKPAGLTSFSSLGDLKRILGTKRIGHTGTLDKFAEGLLVVLVGRYTKLADFLSGLDKRYTALMEFGKETDTLDPEGETIAEAEPPNLDTILGKIPDFLGAIEQRPPEFSAVHIEGERASKRKRRGESPVMPARTVEIRSFSVLEWNRPFLKADISCGKGTYIRSIARDLGRACGSRAYLRGLVRTEVGPFSLDEAVRKGDFDARKDLVRGSEPFKRLGDDAILVVKDSFLDRIKQGMKIEADFFLREPKGRGPFIVFSRENELVAFIDAPEGGFRYRFVAA